MDIIFWAALIVFIVMLVIGLTGVIYGNRPSLLGGAIEEETAPAFLESWVGGDGLPIAEPAQPTGKPVWLQATARTQRRWQRHQPLAGWLSVAGIALAGVLMYGFLKYGAEAYSKIALTGFLAAGTIWCVLVARRVRYQCMDAVAVDGDRLIIRRGNDLETLEPGHWCFDGSYLLAGRLRLRLFERSAHRQAQMLPLGPVGAAFDVQQTIDYLLPILRHRVLYRETQWLWEWRNGEYLLNKIMPIAGFIVVIYPAIWR